MSERSAKILWWLLLLLIVGLTCFGSILGFILGIFIVYIICEALAQLHYLPPRNPDGTPSKPIR